MATQASAPGNSIGRAPVVQYSQSFPRLLEVIGASLAVSTFRSNKLFFLRARDLTLDAHHWDFDRPAGLAFGGSGGNRLIVAGATEIREYRHVPGLAVPLDRAGTREGCFVPHSVRYTGDIGSRDVALLGDELWFVSSRFSCLGTLHDEYSFSPQWRPPFVSAYDGNDRCHLNGMAVRDGRIFCASAFAMSDEAFGWRHDPQASGGVILDVESGTVLVRDLQMPHAPRWHQDQLWLLDSGRGALCRYDWRQGLTEPLAHFEGFPTALDFRGPLAFVGVSRRRPTRELGEGISPSLHPGQSVGRAGIWIFNIDLKRVVGFATFGGDIDEIHDVCVLAGVTYPDLLPPPHVTMGPAAGPSAGSAASLATAAKPGAGGAPLRRGVDNARGSSSRGSAGLDPDATAAPSLSYLICTAPRTGSTLLSEMLAGTQIAGRPDEYFDLYEHNEAVWRARLGITDDQDYVSKVLKAGMTANGVFGLKLHWHQRESLQSKIAREGPRESAAKDHSLPDLLRRRLGTVKYLWLRRRNQVAQGISYYRAVHSGVWRQYEGADASGAADPPFDVRQIASFVRMVEEFDDEWRVFFERHCLTPLVLFYEDLAENQASTVERVLRFLELPTDHILIGQPRIERQSRSPAWEERYRAIRTKKCSEPAAERRVVDSPDKPHEASRPSLIAYATTAVCPRIVAAPIARTWMDQTAKRFAYRCLPILLANQAGWLILNSGRCEVSWNGGPAPEDLRIDPAGDRAAHGAASHFGSGILTFTIPYLFRTSAGFDLHVRGPANHPKDGVAALEGIVETDWSDATFTMNWKMTRPNHGAIFEDGEPIAMLTPIRRGELEHFSPEIQSISSNPALDHAHRAWRSSRSLFNAQLKNRDPEAVKRGWQRHYMRGITVLDDRAPEHRTHLSLSPFVDARPWRDP